jgi:hypothetical protein
MPTKTRSTEREREDREPDDRKEGERMQSVSHKGDPSDDSDEEELAEEDMDTVDEEVDLDALAEGDGPDA